MPLTTPSRDHDRPVQDRVRARRQPVPPRAVVHPRRPRGSDLGMGALVQHPAAHAPPRPHPARRGRSQPLRYDRHGHPGRTQELRCARNPGCFRTGASSSAARQPDRKVVVHRSQAATITCVLVSRHYRFAVASLSFRVASPWRFHVVPQQQRGRPTVNKPWMIRHHNRHYGVAISPSSDTLYVRFHALSNCR